MTISLVGSDTVQSLSGSSIAFTHGITILENDIVFVCVSNNSSKSITGLDGFTSDFSETFASSRYTVLSKVAGASEPATYTFTMSGSDRYNAILFVLRGANTSSIYDVAPLLANMTDGNSLTATANSITTSNNNSLVLFTASIDNSASDSIGSFTNGFSSFVEHDNTRQAHSIASKTQTTAGAVGNTSATINTTRQHHAMMFAINEAAAASYAIDSTPSEIRKTESFNVTVSNPATVPTTLNSGIKINGAAGGTLAPSAVSGSGPYTLTFTWPIDRAGKIDPTGYTFDVTVDAETATTGTIPLLPPTGYSYVDLGTIDTGTEIATQYASAAIESTGQVIYESTSNPDNRPVTVLDDTAWILAGGAVTQDQTIQVSAVEADGTGGGFETLTFQAPVVGNIPVITLTGSTPVAVEQGTSYVDAGATASDVEDGDITGSIVVGGDTVNPSIAGSYVITYDVTDSDGNDAVQVTRTVNVADTIAPVITLTGDAIVNLVVDQDTYTEQGATWTDAIDGIGAAVVGGDTVDMSTIGAYVVTYDVTDAAGNAATQVTRTVNVTAAPVVTITFAAPEGLNIRWGGSFTLEVEHDDGTTSLANVPYNAPAGWETQNVDSLPNETLTQSFVELAKTDPKLLYTASVGDMLAFTSFAGFSVDGQTVPTGNNASGYYQFWDETNDVWTARSRFVTDESGVLTYAAGIPLDGRTNFQTVAEYLRSTGSYNSSQTNAIIKEWLVSEGYYKQLNQALYDYLEGLGYSGSLTQKLAKWRVS